MTLKEYKPKWRWVVVEIVDTTQTAGGLFVPTSAVANSTIAKVISAGPDCTSTKEGDLVVLETVQFAKALELPDTGARKILSILEQQIMGGFEPSTKRKK